MTEAEQVIAAAKAANATVTRSTTTPSKTSKPPAEVGSAITLVRDASFEAGLQLVRQVQSQAFYEGVTQAAQAAQLGNLEDYVTGITAQFIQDLPESKDQPILPPSFWLLDAQAEVVNDGINP